MKKKIIFYSAPAYGHTHPTLNVARELARRGYIVFYYSQEKFRKQIEEAGLIYKPYPYKEEINGNMTRRIGLLLKNLSAITHRVTPLLIKEAQQEKPDCVVHDSIAIGGKIIARVLSVPGVSLSTTVAYSRRAFFAYPQFALQVLQQTLFWGFDYIEMYKNYFRLSKKYGIPMRHFSDMIMSREKLNIVFTTTFFQPYANHFDSSFHFVGPSIYPRGEISDYLKTLSPKKKLVYISYGTVVNDDLSFFKLCIDAFMDSPYQVIISLGNGFEPSVFLNIPKNIIIKKYVNQLAVLEKADVFITHGGMNGISESLYYGVPMVMIPDTHEQRYNVLRVKQSGAGIYLKKAKMTKERLLHAVERVLTEKHFSLNAKKMQENLKKGGGYKEAADLIETYLKDAR